MRTSNGITCLFVARVLKQTPLFLLKRKDQSNMANAVKEVATEKIEIVDQLDEQPKKRGIKFWFLAIPAVFILATGTFLWIRRTFGNEEEA
jgi:hypothetical protein